MIEPRVTVVIATYRPRRQYLSVALRSALNQSERDIEIIVTDDSPDHTAREVVDSFADARVRYRRNPKPLGSASNHWAAFDEARGTYIAVLNHDDWIAPTYVERLVAALERHPTAVLAFCDHWIIDANGRRLDEATNRNSEIWGRSALKPGLHEPFLQLLAQQTVPMAMGTMLRRSALPRHWPERAGPAYDLWLTYLMAREGGGAIYVADRLSAWRSHPENQTTAASLDWSLGAAACWYAVAHDPQCVSLHALARRKAAAGYSGCALTARVAGEQMASLHYAWRSVRARATLRGLTSLLLPLMPTRLIQSARRARNAR